MSFKEWMWACDPVGSLLLVAAATLMLLALNWAGGAYPWSNPHVCANLVVGIVLFIAFCLYGNKHCIKTSESEADIVQNGRADLMASSPTSSSPLDPTSGCRLLPLLSKGGFTTPPSTRLHHSSSSTSDSKITHGTLPSGNCPTRLHQSSHLLP